MTEDVLKHLRQLCAGLLLALSLSIPAFAGVAESPGVADGPTEVPGATDGTAESPGAAGTAESPGFMGIRDTPAVSLILSAML
ncbi:MAG: hypothetical protein M3416_17735 [Acidobacteriota bacterium]|nr:hypothetical protein [Acidobacteriota bacterium]